MMTSSNMIEDETFHDPKNIAKMQLFVNQYSILIFMGMLNLKNNIIMLSCFMFFNCNNNSDYEKNYLLTDEFKIEFQNINEKAILKSAVRVIRNNKIINTGNFKIYSKYSNSISTEIIFKLKDTIFQSDSIIFQINKQKYNITGACKRGLKTSYGRPFCNEFNINGKKFTDEATIID